MSRGVNEVQYWIAMARLSDLAYHFLFRFTGKKLTPLFHDDPYDGIVRGNNLYAGVV